MNRVILLVLIWDAQLLRDINNCYEFNCMLLLTMLKIFSLMNAGSRAPDMSTTESCSVSVVTITNTFSALSVTVGD